MAPSQTTLEDREVVDRADTMAAAGEFRANLVPVGDVRKAEQLAADRGFTEKVSAGFCSNVVVLCSPSRSSEYRFWNRSPVSSTAKNRVRFSPHICGETYSAATGS